MKDHAINTTPATENDDDNEHFRLDKRINVATVFAAVAIAGGLLTWALTMERRITSLESAVQPRREYLEREFIDQQRQADALSERHDDDIRGIRSRFDRQEQILLRIEGKLDKNGS